MIYALSHLVTGNSMDENGLPGWVDILGGLFDLWVLAGVLYTLILL